MHFLLYVCHPADEAKTSLQARRQVYERLVEEHFICRGRFCGHCDYFSIGGRWSGMPDLLRLKHADPPRFRDFLKKYKDIHNAKRALALFKRTYADYEGRPPICRDDPGIDGAPDDARLMDKTLLSELKRGFSEYVEYAIPWEKPNVIFTVLDDSVEDQVISPREAAETDPEFVTPGAEFRKCRQELKLREQRLDQLRRGLRLVLGHEVLDFLEVLLRESADRGGFHSFVRPDIIRRFRSRSSSNTSSAG